MDLKRISESFAAVVPILILCSCIRLGTYYSNWHISIFDYLSPSELLFSFIQPGLIFIGIAASGFVIMVGHELWKKFKLRKEIKKLSIELNKKPADLLDEKNEILIIIVLIIFFGISILIYSTVKWSNWDIFLVILFHFLFFVAIILTIDGLQESLKSKLEDKGTEVFNRDETKAEILERLQTERQHPEQHAARMKNQLEMEVKQYSHDHGSIFSIVSLQSIIIGSIVILLSASFFYGRYQIHSTVIDPLSCKITLSDTSNTITNKNLIYLGKTSNYFFLYDNITKQATIIPSVEVKAINIKYDH